MHQSSIRYITCFFYTIENNKVDITEFKAQLYQENVHNLNPTLFKRVNDMARKTNFEGELTEEQFVNFFMAGDLLSPNKPPSVYDLTLLFEMLDEGRTGMISAVNLRNYLELAQRMKDADFDIKRYNDQLALRGDIKEKFDQI